MILLSCVSLGDFFRTSRNNPDIIAHSPRKIHTFSERFFQSFGGDFVVKAVADVSEKTCLYVSQLWGQSEAPLCKGSCQRKLTEGLILPEGMVQTIPPTEIKDFGHLPLHKGGFRVSLAEVVHAIAQSGTCPTRGQYADEINPIAKKEAKPPRPLSRRDFVPFCAIVEFVLSNSFRVELRRVE